MSEQVAWTEIENIEGKTTSYRVMPNGDMEILLRIVPGSVWMEKYSQVDPDFASIVPEQTEPDIQHWAPDGENET